MSGPMNSGSSSTMFCVEDAWGAAFCCGTSSGHRRDALEAIGGFATNSVTEVFSSLSSSTERLAHGHLNEQLSVGLAPEGMKEYLTQRGRLVSRSDADPALAAGARCRVAGKPCLSHRPDRRLSLLGISFPFKLLCLLAPIVYWFTGLTVGSAQPATSSATFLPYYAAVMITLGW